MHFSFFFKGGIFNVILIGITMKRTLNELSDDR